MTIPNDFAGFFAALEQNPELQEAMRNHVLGQELLRLPVVVQQQGELLAHVQERLTELGLLLRDTTEQIASYALASSRVLTTTVERLDHVESDLAELKAAQARLEASVQLLRESQVRMEGDIVEMKGDIAELKADVVEMKGDITELKADVVEMKGDIAELKADVVEMKGDIAELKADVVEMKGDIVEMKGDIAELKADVVEMKGDITELKAGQNRMQGQLNNLIGTDYERQVARRAPRIVRRHLDLRQATVVYGINVPDGMSVRIQELLEQINPDQADDLERTDLILTGSTPAGQSTYAVAEVSRTIDEHDVDRAHRRSQILQRASGTICKAIVIGTAISDANRQRAAQDDVTVAIMVD